MFNYFIKEDVLYRMENTVTVHPSLIMSSKLHNNIFFSAPSRCLTQKRVTDSIEVKMDLYNNPIGVNKDNKTLYEELTTAIKDKKIVDLTYMRDSYKLLIYMELYDENGRFIEEGVKVCICDLKNTILINDITSDKNLTYRYVRELRTRVSVSSSASVEMGINDRAAKKIHLLRITNIELYMLKSNYNASNGVSQSPQVIDFTLCPLSKHIKELKDDYLKIYDYIKQGGKVVEVSLGEEDKSFRTCVLDLSMLVDIPIVSVDKQDEILALLKKNEDDLYVIKWVKCEQQDIGARKVVRDDQDPFDDSTMVKISTVQTDIPDIQENEYAKLTKIKK